MSHSVGRVHKFLDFQASCFSYFPSFSYRNAVSKMSRSLDSELPPRTLPRLKYFSMNASSFLFLLPMHHGMYSRLKGPARSVDLPCALDLIQWKCTLFCILRYTSTYTLLCTALFVTGYPSDPHPPPKKKKRNTAAVVRHFLDHARSFLLPLTGRKLRRDDRRSREIRSVQSKIRKVSQKAKPKVE